MRKLFLFTIALVLFLPLLTSSCFGVALIHIKQGDGYAAKGQTEQAIAEYTKAIEINPKAATAYSGRGTVYFSQSQWTPAIEDFNLAIDLDPDLARDLNPKQITAYYSRGKEYNKNWQYDLAVRDLSKAIDSDPAAALAGMYAERGKAYLELGKSGLARADYNKAIEIDPQSMTAQELMRLMSLASECSNLSTLSMDGAGTVNGEFTSGNTTVSIAIPFTIAVSCDFVNQKFQMSFDMEYSIPGYDKLRIMADQYILNGWQYTHLRYLGHETWGKTELTDSKLTSLFHGFRQSDSTDNMTTITLLNNEKVEGVDCYQFQINVDPDMLTEYMQAHKLDFAGTDLLLMPNIKELTVKEWISKEDYLPLKLEEDATMEIMYTNSGYSSTYIQKILLNMQMSTKYRDFNEPVDIELPSAALRATEIFILPHLY
jgi:tetratricopeptide (TPR) repeat protein